LVDCAIKISAKAQTVAVASPNNNVCMSSQSIELPGSFPNGSLMRKVIDNDFKALRIQPREESTEAFFKFYKLVPSGRLCDFLKHA
jgi:hypothetical protein